MKWKEMSVFRRILVTISAVCLAARVVLIALEVTNVLTVHRAVHDILQGGVLFGLTGWEVSRGLRILFYVLAGWYIIDGVLSLF